MKQSLPLLASALLLVSMTSFANEMPAMDTKTATPAADMKMTDAKMAEKKKEEKDKKDAAMKDAKMSAPAAEAPAKK
jgi:hypothetical protein